MWVEVNDRSELRSRSVVDLRVVDLFVVDVMLDMDELTAVGLLVIGPDTALDLGLEVKAFREARYRRSSLGCKVKVDLIGQNYE